MSNELYPKRPKGIDFDLHSAKEKQTPSNHQQLPTPIQIIVQPKPFERKHSLNPVECDRSQSEITMDDVLEPPVASGRVPDPHMGEIQRRSIPGDAIDAHGQNKVVWEVLEVSVGQPKQKSVSSFSSDFFGKRYYRKHDLRLNITKDHADKIAFVSQVCREDNVLETNRLPRQKILLDEKPHVCVICNKSYHYQLYLKMHSLVHISDNRFEYRKYGKTFRTKRDLMKHRSVHTGKKSFLCPECGKSFGRKYDLSRHSRIHTGEKSFHCPHCVKSFGSKVHLSQHSQVHTSEKPFQCLECGKSFARKGNLKTHSSLHTGENLFHCPKCEKSYATKSKLTNHQFVHSNIKFN